MLVNMVSQRWAATPALVKFFFAVPNGVHEFPAP